MSKFSIHGGTAKSDIDLCRGCRNAHIIRGQNAEQVMCRAMSSWSDSNVVRFPVSFCTEYADRSMPTLDDLRPIAWDLTSAKTTKQAGFSHPSKRNEDELPPMILPDGRKAETFD